MSFDPYGSDEVEEFMLHLDQVAIAAEDLGKEKFLGLLQCTAEIFVTSYTLSERVLNSVRKKLKTKDALSGNNAGVVVEKLIGKFLLIAGGCPPAKVEEVTSWLVDEVLEVLEPLLTSSVIEEKDYAIPDGMPCKILLNELPEYEGVWVSGAKVLESSQNKAGIWFYKVELNGAQYRVPQFNLIGENASFPSVDDMNEVADFITRRLF